MNKLKNMKFRFEYLLIINIILVMITIVVGILLRMDSSAAACPDWPTCFGAWEYPETSIGQYHFWHRLISAISLISVLSAAIISFQKQKRSNGTKKLAVSLTILLFAQIAIGYFVREPIPWIRSVHFFVSLISIMVATGWLVRYQNANNHIIKINSFQKMSRVLTLSSLLMVIAGILVSLTNSSEYCSGFPLCSIQDFGNPFVLFVVAHRLIALLVLGLSINLLYQAWVNYRTNITILVSTTITVILLFGQALVGAMQVLRGISMDLAGLHAVAAISFIVGLIFVQGSARYAQKSPHPEKHTIFNDALRRKDFYLLNKPIIVLLLLVITYAGMVVGGEEIPSLKLTFWTLLAGGLAAGGSSALNQFMDRKSIYLCNEPRIVRFLPVDYRLRKD